MVVFVNESARTLARNLQKSPSCELVGFFEDRDMDRIGGPIEGLPYLGKACSTAQYVRDHNIDVVFVVLPDDGERHVLNLLEEFDDTTAPLYYVPDFLIINLFEAQVPEVEGDHGAGGRGNAVLRRRRHAEAAVRFRFAFAVIVMLSPLLIAVALTVKLISPGPVIFNQKRYGHLKSSIFNNYSISV